MEMLVATIGEYSFVVAPMLVLWAIATLYVQAGSSNSAYSQVAYFGAMLAIGVLTTRSMLMHETCWLVNAVSLGVLIVSGALRRPDESQTTVWSSY